MSIFDFLTMIGGLSLFLFGMTLMGQALERRAGNKLKLILSKTTSGKLSGFLTGCAVTSVIQSSSATTVMVVGFVNSGLMSLKQAINVIMGANVGTTVTSWILSLGGISDDSVLMKLLKPSSFTPVLALCGVILYMFCADDKKKDTGLALLGFSTLMFGMDTMSKAVSVLSDVPEFANLLIMFKNPILGVLAGTVLTAIIQSSSASVGILQALSDTGKVSLASAVPIIMGQNIGTCITAIISSVGTNKNAKRAAFVHLSFNVIGTAVMLSIYCAVKGFLSDALLSSPISRMEIAIIHSAFNISCALLLMPASSVLEKLACFFIKDENKKEKKEELDERLLSTPSLALMQCGNLTVKMAKVSEEALSFALESVTNYTESVEAKIRKDEELTDKYEDMIGTYLIKLSSQKMSEEDSEKSAEILKLIGDFERIADHAVNVLESSIELRDKNLTLSEEAVKDYEVMKKALKDVVNMAMESYVSSDSDKAIDVEPLEQVIDNLKDTLRDRHIKRMQNGECSIAAGFVWSDLLTNMERVSDHCSNIAGCVIETKQHELNLHEMLRHQGERFGEKLAYYSQKYSVE